MKVLVVKPLLEPYEKEISGTLEEMQEIVGGTIQAIYPFDDPEVALICNDDGKLLGLPLNRTLQDNDGNIYDIIAGTFFICAAPTTSDKFESLTETQLEIFKDKYKDVGIILL